MARKTNQQTQSKKSEKSGTTDTGRTEVFAIRAPEAMKVQLVGDFTGWQDRPIDLQKGTDGTWKATVILPPGTHQYKFVVDSRWTDDPDCTQRAPNPFGSENMTRQVA